VVFPLRNKVNRKNSTLSGKIPLYGENLKITPAAACGDNSPPRSMNKNKKNIK
jgi:hypothetical protein